MKCFLLMYVIFIIVVFVAIMIEEYNGCSFAKTPKEIYECNDFNMFAAWLLFLIGFILNPLWNITNFINWLLHVGRKGKR